MRSIDSEDHWAKRLATDFPKQASFVGTPLTPSKEKYKICQEVLKVQKSIATDHKALEEMCMPGFHAIHRDEDNFAIGSKEGTVRVRRIDKKDDLILAGHTGAIVDVKVVGDRVVSADIKGVLKIWDRNTGVCLKTIETGFTGGMYLEISGGRIHLREILDHGMLDMYTLTGQRVPRLSKSEVFSGRVGSQKFSLLNDGKVVLFNQPPTKPLLDKIQIDLDGGRISYATQVEDRLIAVCSKQDQYGFENDIHVIQPNTKQQISLKLFTEAPITAVEKKGNLLFISTATGNISVYDLSTGGCIDSYNIPSEKRKGFVHGLKFVDMVTPMGSKPRLMVLTTAPDLYFAKAAEVRQIGNTVKMRQAYFALGQYKWQEGVEATLHHHGPNVFDQGLHGGTVEPGFMENWKRAAIFLSNNFHKKFTSDTYLDVHRTAFQHILLGAPGSYVKPENIGKFRGIDNPVFWNISKDTVISEEAIQELEEMNDEIEHQFGVRLARFVPKADGTTLEYQTMTEQQVRAIHEYFLDTFHEEMEAAQTPKQKLTAIAKLYRCSEWLHPVWDGTGRCDMLMLNFLLTQNGFHPAILEQPYICNLVSLNDWVHHLEEGLEEWENRAAMVLAAQQAPANNNALMAANEEVIVLS